MACHGPICQMQLRGKRETLMSVNCVCACISKHQHPPLFWSQPQKNYENLGGQKDSTKNNFTGPEKVLINNSTTTTTTSTTTGTSGPPEKNPTLPVVDKGGKKSATPSLVKFAAQIFEIEKKARGKKKGGLSPKR